MYRSPRSIRSFTRYSVVGARRSARAVRTPIWIWGAWSSSWRNARSVITRVRTGDVVVIVAFRGVFAISAISPKKSPGPIEATFLPPRAISAVPSIKTKNSRPVSPSLISTLPSGRSISSAMPAISASSCFEAEAKSGTPLIRSIFELRPSFICADPTRGSGCSATHKPGAVGARTRHEPGRPSTHEVDAGEPRPLLVRCEELRRLVDLDPAAPEGRAELDEAEIADESVAEAAETLQRDHPQRPRPQAPLTEQTCLDGLDRLVAQALEVDRAADADEGGGA